MISVTQTWHSTKKKEKKRKENHGPSLLMNTVVRILNRILLTPMGVGKGWKCDLGAFSHPSLFFKEIFVLYWLTID